MRVLVVGGPADGLLADPRLGPRWPWMLLARLGRAYPLFWYVLRGGVYVPEEA